MSIVSNGIGGQECCRPRSNRRQDVRALALVTRALIQGYVEENGNAGVDDIERWHDTEVVDFLLEMDSTPAID